MGERMRSTAREDTQNKGNVNSSDQGKRKSEEKKRLLKTRRWTWHKIRTELRKKLGTRRSEEETERQEGGVNATH